MKLKKTAAAVLAAVMAFGAVSAVSFAETAATEESTTEQTWTDEDVITWKNPFEIREEESKYSITLENAVVDGKEKVAVKLSGLPKEILTHKWEYYFKYDIEDEDRYKEEGRNIEYLAVTIDVGEEYLFFGSLDTDKKFECFKTKPSHGPSGPSDDYISSYYWGCYWMTRNLEFQKEIDLQTVMKTTENTFELETYLDSDDKFVKTLLSSETTTVCAFTDLDMYSGSANGGNIGSNSCFGKIYVSSDGKIIDENIYDENGDLSGNKGYYIEYKERVKITNNLNAPETSNPTTSAPTTSNPTTSTPATSDTTSSGTSDPTTSEPATSEPATSEPTTSEPNSEAPATTPNEFKPTLTDESLDEETNAVLSGITVTDNNGAFEDDVVMNVSSIGKTDHSFEFDITFTKDGKKVQPKGTVTVKVPVPEFLKNGDIYVYHYDENGNATLVSSKVEGGFVIFEADHFSKYALLSQLLDTESSETSTPGSTVPATSETSKPNPNTGIGYALFPILAAASAAVVIFKKKK